MKKSNDTPRGSNGLMVASAVSGLLLVPAASLAGSLISPDATPLLRTMLIPSVMSLGVFYAVVKVLKTPTTRRVYLVQLLIAMAACLALQYGRIWDAYLSLHIIRDVVVGVAFGAATNLASRLVYKK